MAENEDIVNNDRAYQVAWIVYINGIEVPVVSASVSYGVWQIPECQITMIPDEVLQRLGAEDRISVQVFYCDYWQVPNKPEFRLMFDGEIVGWSYVNVQRGRTLSFSCVDYMQIFTQLFFFFMGNVGAIATGESGKQLGVNINTVDLAGYGAIYPYSLFTQGLADPGPTPTSGDAGEPMITRPLDFVYNIVRSLIKTNHFNRTVPAANFFSPWTRRTNFHRRFVALPFLEEPGLDENGEQKAGVFPILRAVQAQYAVSAVADMASNIGTSASMWDMLQQILQTLMMEVCMLPTAACVSSDFGTPSTEPSVYTGTTTQQTASGGAATEAPQAPPKVQTSGQGLGLQINGPAISPSLTGGHNLNHLTNYFVKPQFMFGLPPVSNVFFPSQITQFAYDENFITQPTRMYFNDDNLLGILDPNNNSGSPGLNALLRDALAVGHPEEVHLAARRSADVGALENNKNLLVYPEEFFKGPVVDRRPMPRWFMYIQQKQQGQPVDPLADPAPDPGLDRQISPGDSSRNVYRLYAAYEFHKEKYSRRSGGLELAFNPYPIPGFPCAVFDRRSTQFDIFGYVMNVRQNLTSRSWSTSVAYSYGRTFRETFALMQRQATIENEGINLNQADISEAVTQNKRDKLNKTADPVGAIAMAPAEPLAEVRDVIQNFDRAEAFYNSLFYRNPSPIDDTVTQNQLRKEADRRSQEEKVAAAATQQSSVGFTLDPSLRKPTRDAQITSDLNGRRSLFYYPDIIEFETDDGNVQQISITGIDASSRAKALGIIAGIRAGKATAADVTFVQAAVGRQDIVTEVNAEGAAVPVTDPTLKSILDSTEIAIRTAKTNTNVVGDQKIKIKETAQQLFDSYEAAMQYVARPICTLDEYVDFLGADGKRLQKVTPSESLTFGDSRTFPAHYYQVIRQYTPGPPAALPEVPVTNAQVQSSPEGVAQISGTEQDLETVEVQGLATNFPDNRADWNSILAAYRNNALLKLEPRT